MKRIFYAGIFAMALFCAMCNASSSAEQGKNMEILIRENDQARCFQCGQVVSFYLPEVSEGWTLQEMELSNDGYTIFRKKSFVPGEEPEVRGTLNQPGFLRCRAMLKNDSGEKKELMTVAAFDPEQVKPGMPEPADFDAFWDNAKAEIAKVPEDWQKVRLDDRSTEHFDVYMISAANLNGKRIYGILSVPKKEGKFPAIGVVPGAGPATQAASFSPDTISLIMHVHEYEPCSTFEEAQKKMNEFYVGRPVPQGCPQYYTVTNAGDPEQYFFYTALLGMNRLLSFLQTEAKFNGRIGLYGGSQGGFSLALAAWNQNVERIVLNVPAYCDFGAFAQGRMCGSPMALTQATKEEYIRAVPGMLYFDLVNFSRRVTIPATVLVGWCDTCSTPGTVYSMFNTLASEDKKIIDMPRRGHGAWEENAAAWQELVTAMHEDK